MIFVDPGVKINGTHCNEVLLTQRLLPVVASSLSSNKTILLLTEIKLQMKIRLV